MESMPRILALALALLHPGLARAQDPAGATRSSPEIVANGSGVVTLSPDRATVLIAVVTRAASAAEAGRQNADRILPVIAALRRQGLRDSAIVTTGYSVSIEGNPPDPTTRSREVRVTYVARNAIRVSLSQLELLGRVLDSALAAGASEIANIDLASSQAADGRRRAIAAAVRAARADAEAAAAAAGGSIGAIIEVSLTPDYGAVYNSPRVDARMAYAVASTTFMPSDVRVSAEARVRFAFIPRP